MAFRKTLQKIASLTAKPRDLKKSVMSNRPDSRINRSETSDRQFTFKPRKFPQKNDIK